MLPYKNLIIIDKKSQTAVYKQIAVQFTSLIKKGKLLPGAALPSTRILASDLELHRKTVIAAYETLVAEDWIDSLPRKGYIVSFQLPTIKPKTYTKNRSSAYNRNVGFLFEENSNIFDPSSISKKNDIIIDDGLPDTSLLPLEAIREQYRKALDFHFLKRMNAGWEIEGSVDFRDALCDFLNQTRGIDIRRTNLLSTRGAQMAIYLAASLIIKPGDKVIVSKPSYYFANAMFKSLGAELIEVPVNSQGMCIDTVEAALKQHNIKLLYIIPHHHHPTTVTMSSERRRDLLQLIVKHQVAVIEDDYDYDFQFQYAPYLPLASGSHEGNIIYIGSLTKVLGTSFRLGYMVAGEKFIKAAAKQKMLIDLKGDIFTEHIVAGLIESGELNKLIQKANKVYRQRCHNAINLFTKELEDEIQISKPNGGMALWLQFRSDIDLMKVLNNASTDGVLIESSIYNKERIPEFNAMRLGFASLSDGEMIRTIEILKKNIRLL